MPDYSIYRDIAERTGGDIYVGVVGPVRSGKSTFIKRFMESVVLPNIEEGATRDRARDELPQSAAGKTVMTTEPKFIPEDAVPILLGDNAKMRVRMIDCVGYLIPDAMGIIEDGAPRMVRTPWQEDPMPFAQAAETGTRKVITDHSTIGMLITTDGSIGEFGRDAYVEAEERIVRELKALKKPFAVILNSKNPSSEETTALAYSLEEKYGVPVALVNCMEIDADDIREILGMILEEFPVTEVSINLPEWVCALDESHPIRTSVLSSVCKCADHVSKMGNVRSAFDTMSENEYLEKAEVEELDLGTGKAKIRLFTVPSLFYQVISELTGLPVENEKSLMQTMCSLAEVKSKYERVAEALDEVEEKGYGIVMPEVEDLRLEEPKIAKQSGGYGVKLRAAAQSIHMIRANIETEINPVVGTEQQSEDLIKYLLREFESDPKSIWESNLFGKSLYELINDGLHAKLDHIPAASRQKLSETLERIVNEGSNGLICILL
ncbi:MAG: stage IV sporulation protein A [Ruminococcaceae bacterium]|nr:stage IV sporulation protein A [Oscillospiraceae bacterium]